MDPPHHFQGDARQVIREHTARFYGFHPPCTYVCGSGIHWNNRGRGWEKTDAALGFILWCMSRRAVGKSRRTSPFPPERIMSTHQGGDREYPIGPNSCPHCGGEYGDHVADCTRCEGFYSPAAERYVCRGARVGRCRRPFRLRPVGRVVTTQARWGRSFHFSF